MNLGKLSTVIKICGISMMILIMFFKIGSKYQDGMIQDKDGNNIQLKTVDDLYDLLTGGLYARNDIT